MSSIRRRILAPLLPLTALALAAVAVGIFAAVRRDLVGALDRTLLATARGVAAGVDVDVDGTFDFDLETEFDPEGGRRFYLVTDEGGGVLASSLPGPPARISPPAGTPAFRDMDLAGRRYRVCLVAVERRPGADEEDRRDWLRDHPGEALPEAGPRTFWVAVGSTTAGLDATLAAVGTEIVAGFGVLFAVLVLVPAWVVGRALAPLRDLSAQADAVGPDAPRARLDDRGTPKEVGGLVAALNRALDRLAEAYERQKRFTADAAHELRTPLTTLRTQCEVALRRARDAGELRETLEGVHRTVLRLTGLVEGLLRLTRLQNGRDRSEMRPVDLCSVVRDAARVHEAAARAKGIDLAVELPSAIPVAGDPVLLEECVSNLMENAVRYTPAGGRVRVRASGRPAPAVRVEDTGIGIPPEHIPGIFDRFHRVDPSRSRGEGGTGLGLAIAREIARLHGGDIIVESTPGRGSRFEIRLPPAPPAAGI